MKDEEMAEKKYCKGCKWRIEQCLWAWRKVNGLNEPNEKNCSCKEVPAFRAGLKAGRPQWHDLLKDPNDLPENKRKVWCDYGDGYGKGFYDKDDGSWLIEGHMYCSIINAWCELPTFEKESK